MTDTATLNKAAQAARWAAAAGFAGNDIRTAVALAYAESNFSTLVTHRNADGSTDYGEWQINSVHKQFGSFATNGWQNGQTNAKMAYSVYKAQGFGAWSTYGGSRYLAGLTIFDEANGQGLVGDLAQAAAGNAAPLAADYATGDSGVTDFITALENPHVWLRVAMVLVGGGLVLAGISIAARPLTDKAAAGAAQVAKIAAL